MRALIEFLSGYEPTYRTVVKGYPAADIVRLERALGRPIPSAYRDFLQTVAANLGFQSEDLDFDIEEVIDLATSKKSMLEGLHGQVTPIAEDDSPSMMDYYLHLGRPNGDGDGEIVRSPSGTQSFIEYRIGCPSLRSMLLSWGFRDVRMLSLQHRARVVWRSRRAPPVPKLSPIISALLQQQRFTPLDVTGTPVVTLYERGDCAAEVHAAMSGSFIALYLAGQDRDEVERIMPAPGTRAAPVLADEQRPVPLANEYWGDPSCSSLRIEGQGTHARMGTDIYLQGHAWSPGGRPTEQSMIALCVGAYQRGAVVFGERLWRQGLAGATPSSPRAFTRLPHVYERCFGGADYPQNPVGRGLFARDHSALGEPLPNFEDPRAQLSGPRDRPAPAGMGPVARSWLPRRQYGGTYDQAWRKTRAPLWPKDVDPRLMNAAAPGLVANPGLEGGEAVRLIGFHPDGPLGFTLPRLRLQAKFYRRTGTTRTAMRLDALQLEPDDSSLTLYWRAATAVEEDLFEVERVVLRQRGSWESTP